MLYDRPHAQRGVPSPRLIAELVGCSRATLYRVLDDAAEVTV